MKIPGLIALVTGGSSGIGRAFCLEVARQRAKVAIVDVDEQHGNELQQEINQSYPNACKFFKCDVTNSSSLKRTFADVLKHFGKIHILLNSAGTADESNPAKTIALNLTSLVESTFLGAEAMRINDPDPAGQRGVIINIASMAGLFPQIFSPVYSASKYGVVGFSRSLENLSGEGIRVSCICPTYTDTPLLRSGMSKAEAFAQIVELQGIITVDAVVQGILQLIEDDTKAGAVMRVTREKGIDYQLYRAPKSIGNSKL